MGVGSDKLHDICDIGLLILFLRELYKNTVHADVMDSEVTQFLIFKFLVRKDKAVFLGHDSPSVKKELPVGIPVCSAGIPAVIAAPVVV